MEARRVSRRTTFLVNAVIVVIAAVAGTLLWNGIAPESEQAQILRQLTSNFRMSFEDPTAFTNGQPTVVAVVNEECPFCQASEGGWIRLGNRSETEGLRFNIVSLDGPESAARLAGRLSASWPVQSVEELPAIEELRAAVPATVLLDPGGEILRIWFGAMTEGRADELVVEAHEILAAAGHSK